MEIPNSNELARILIIDSEGEAGEETSSYLLGAGYEVEIAMDGVQGLTLIESFQPACVLCDLGLDTIDGISVLKKIADKLYQFRRYLRQRKPYLSRALKSLLCYKPAPFC